MNTYREYGQKTAQRIDALLKLEGISGIPSKYADFLKLDQMLRKLFAMHFPLVLSDNYEHFMACLPGKKYAAQHVLIRRQIGGFTATAGYWKWLEFLSHQLTHDEIDLAADFYTGKHNNFPRQFDSAYWHRVVDEYDGWLPIRVEIAGEGTVFTGVPFAIAQVYGEKPAVWVNEPMYIQTGHLCHVATVAAQFAEALGDPWRFIEVAFRALQNSWGSDDFLAAMHVGGGIISTSNDMGAFVNGAPFKPTGTTGHCYYQQFETLKDSLRALLGSPLGMYATVLLDIVEHRQGFEELHDLIANEGYRPPFAERPDSGKVAELGMHDLTVLEDEGTKINVVFEDGQEPSDVLAIERMRKQRGLSAERAIFGAGGAFLGPRRRLETAYKAALFHNGTPEQPTDIVETMKICLDDEMKQSLPGMIGWMVNEETGICMMRRADESIPTGYRAHGEILYDGLSIPGKPFFHPGYSPASLIQSDAIQAGVRRSKDMRALLGRQFTLDIGENRNAIGMTKALREKRKRLYERARLQLKE